MIVSIKRFSFYVGFAACMFLVGFSGMLEPIGKLLVVFFKSYTEAELIKLNATAFINQEGLAEYVIGLDPLESDFSGHDFLLSQSGVSSVRDTAFSNWYVIEVEAGMPEYINALKGLQQTEFVLQNRGLWLCH
ncbi:MAG: hypothetical protein OXD44_05680 [Gammaproteobacteria bacterium]|nr:hypothetical protein [Gammaproteobacteria bacterium]MCY4227777.1 hypothetical protein [Gammaproteobacteria bacterium]MCY4313175.1 hypothetical protein [Gammaproteobacteria bacterium]